MIGSKWWYEIIVTDERGDRHRHLTEILPDREDEEYLNGELVIDISETETVTYMLNKIISWSSRAIDTSGDVPTVAYKEAKL